MRTWFRVGLGRFRFRFGLNDLNHFQTRWLWFPARNSGALMCRRPYACELHPLSTQVNATRPLILHLPTHTTWREHSYGWETQAKPVITSLDSIYLDNENAISPNQNIVNNLDSTEVGGNVTFSFNRARFLPIFSQSSCFIPSLPPTQNPDDPEWKKIHLFSWHPSVWNIYSRQAAVHTKWKVVTDALSAPFFS